MSKKFYYGDSARDLILKGAEIVSRTVGVTLGAMGRNVVIGFKGRSPHVTKDGVSVVKQIEVKDAGESIGVNLLKEVATKILNEVGDGTTTGTVVTYSMMKHATAFVYEGSNYSPIGIKRALQLFLDKMLDSLQSLSKPISDEKDVYNIALTSANNDVEIAKVVSEAYAIAGKNGIVNVEISHGEGLSYEHKSAFILNKGFIHNSLAGNNNTLLLEKPLVLIIDGRIVDLSEVLDILTYSSEQKLPLLIVCDGVDDMTIQAIAANNSSGALRCSVVKAAGHGEDKQAILQDLSLYTGASIINPSTKKLKDLEINDLGKADKVKTTAKYTEISSNDSKKNAEIDVLIKNLQDSLNDDSLHAAEKAMIQNRIANLSTSVVTIKLGGYTETELFEKRDRLDDAIQAVKSAYHSGYTYGSFSALLHISDELAGQDTDDDLYAAADIITTGICNAYETMMANAGIKVDLDTYDEVMTYGKGYDLRSGKLVDLNAAGIYDSTKAIQSILESSIATTMMFILTESVIVDE